MGRVLYLSLFAMARAVNVLVVHTMDDANQNEQLAEAFAAGVRDADGANVLRVVPVNQANYARDVVEWADAIAIGSSVDNGNVQPELLEFINSFDIFDTSCSGKVAASFATGGSAAAGLQPVLEQINRALLTFRFVLAGGDSWENSEGTGAVTNGTSPIANKWLALARSHGQRLAWVTKAVRSGAPKAAPPPPPGHTSQSPPGWGDRWSARIAANLTQVGYDAGLVLVNFTTACDASPALQKSRTVYGDFYTVLTRCDLGFEFTLAPASRGSGCSARKVGVDVDARVCEACGCPFCVRHRLPNPPTETPPTRAPLHCAHMLSGHPHVHRCIALTCSLACSVVAGPRHQRHILARAVGRHQEQLGTSVAHVRRRRDP